MTVIHNNMVENTSQCLVKYLNIQYYMMLMLLPTKTLAVCLYHSNFWMVLMGIVLFSKGSEARLPNIGVISYWDPDPNLALYDKLPSKSLALINPDSGIFTDQTRNLVSNLNDFQTVVINATNRKINILGYVPTGYFNHSCDIDATCQTFDRIDAQVQAYFANFPSLTGIFFDETAPAIWNCFAFQDQYQSLRRIVRKYNVQATIAFNTAIPDSCVLAGLQPGEIIVVFEDSFAEYSNAAAAIAACTQAAHNSGAIVWNLIYSVPNVSSLESTITIASSMNIDLFYATDIGGNWRAGDNTYGSPPIYWSTEVALLNPN